jgi:O-antigen/teichoic acid export membrane protein
LGAPPRVWLQRRLDLSYLALLSLAQAVSHVGVAAILLYQGYGASGVVWGALVGVSVAVLLAWVRVLVVGGFRYRAPSRALVGAFAASLAKISTNGLFTYVNAQVDKILVAGTLGPAAMSYYGMAWNASRFPAGVLAQSLRFSLVPTVARLQDDAAAVERGLRESLRHTLLVAAPIAALLFVAAPSLVAVVLGPRWIPVVPALRVMSLAVLAAPLLESAATLLIGMDRAHLTAIPSTLAVIALVGLTPSCASRWGVVGAAWANLGSFALLTASAAVVARVVFSRIRWLAAGVVVAPLVAATAAAVCAFALGRDHGVGIVRLLVEGGAVAVVYPAAIVALGGRAMLADLLALLRRSWSEPRAAAPAPSPGT